MATARDTRIASRLVEWFRVSARSLPWREPVPRDAYMSFVSEAMLQQTQVARVLEKFDAFVARFPTIRSLASAPEESVLAAWSGLGYYRRARNLQNAARAIVERHGGIVPSDVAELRALPGVGEYTAGAIASIVFGEAVAAVDANAKRVILRIEGKLPEDASEKWLAQRAFELVRAAPDAGAFNEGLMELGALVCSAAAPKCGACPMSRMCRARAAGTVAEIRPAKAKTKRTALFFSCALVTDAKGRVRALARPTTGAGLWAGMWQPPTIERTDRHATAAEIRTAFGVKGLTPLLEFEHVTSHRLVHFQAWRAGFGKSGADRLPGAFVEPKRLAELPLANPHRRLFAEAGKKPAAE